MHANPVLRSFTATSFRLAAIGALWTAAISTAWADPSRPINAPAAPSDQAVTWAEQQAVLAYWTPERMKHAVPMDVMPRKDQGTASPAKPSSKRRVILPVAPLSGPHRSVASGVLAFPELGAPWLGGGQVASTSGRLFFDIPGTGPSSCSANAVVSINKNTLMTAGHCLTLDGITFEKVIFVPGYHHGQAPYGVWTAKQPPPRRNGPIEPPRESRRLFGVSHAALA